MQAGITLIALVVTIIVLLILAGISIGMLSGNNGILKKSREAKNETVKGEVIEKIELANLSAIAKSKGEDNYETLIGELARELGTEGTDWSISAESTNPWIVTVGDVEYSIAHGSAEATPTPTEPQPGESGYDGGSYNDPYIPVGFTHTGSEDWNHGYTITGNSDSTNPGDQFVWIPCTTDTTNTALTQFAKITTGTYNSNELTLHPSGGTNAEVNIEDSTVADIRTSVGTYGGFYIAKYEAGITGTTNNDSLTTKTVTNGSVKPLSQSGVGLWDGISREESLTIAKSMIPISSGAKSTLISGECWDTTLAWITATADSTYAENSAGKGWYYEVSSSSYHVHTTGYYGTNTNNIFDMGGNAFEYTSENCKLWGGQYVVIRGGDYSNPASNCPASHRDTYQGYTDIAYTFRVVMYK